MKCPECDLEQPDSTAVCSNCGLSFEVWRQHNPDFEKKASEPGPEMTFPEAAEEKKEEEVGPPEEKPQDKAPEKSEMKKDWTRVLLFGAGAVVLAGLGTFFLMQKHSNPISEPNKVTPSPAVNLTPQTPSISGTLTPVFSPSGTATPVQSLPLAAPTLTPVEINAPIQPKAAKPTVPFTPTATDIPLNEDATPGPASPSATPSEPSATGPVTTNTGSAPSTPVETRSAGTPDLLESSGAATPTP